MREWVEITAAFAAGLIELIGVVFLAGVSVYAIVTAVVSVFRRSSHPDIWTQTRQTLGQGILFALDLLVAADIIETVAVDLTFQSLFVLAVIVLIRTFLSFTLEVELTGHWPWQGKKKGTHT